MRGTCISYVIQNNPSLVLGSLTTKVTEDTKQNFITIYFMTYARNH